jgi:predicted nucleic acid-binding protein
MVDDLAARRTAQSLGISIIGTIGLLILARQKTLISTLKPHLDTLFRLISLQVTNFD